MHTQLQQLLMMMMMMLEMKMLTMTVMILLLFCGKLDRWFYILASLYAKKKIEGVNFRETGK